MNTFKAEKRDLAEKAKKLRREGFVTGNVFGRDLAESIPVKFAKTEAERLKRQPCDPGDCRRADECSCKRN